MTNVVKKPNKQQAASTGWQPSSMTPQTDGAPAIEQTQPADAPVAPADSAATSDVPPADAMTPPGVDLSTPVAPIGPAMATLTLPFAELDPTQRLPLHLKIDANGFTVEQRTALMRYYLGCLRDHCKLANGRPVVTMADSARYWLEQMSRATPMEASA